MGRGTDREEHVPAEASTAAPWTGSIPSTEVLKLDYVYDALAHPRRRYLCYTLLVGAEWSLTDLSTKIAAWGSDVPEHAVTDEQRKRVYVSLYHAQVPRLVETGVVTFDEANETLSAGENAPEVLTALRSVGTVLDADQEEHATGEDA